MRITALAMAVAALCALAVTAKAASPVVNPPPKGSVSIAQGLQAWDRIYEVVSHPRCSNCHVGASDRPMWSGPNYGKTRPHGMNIRAGESRIGAETIACQTCHGRSNASIPHAPPGVDGYWQLAPVEADWFGRSSKDICEQLRDPERNGDRTFLEVAGHLGHDLVLQWAWDPGPGRQSAPYSLQAHVDDVLAWGVAGTPCPN